VRWIVAGDNVGLISPVEGDGVGRERRSELLDRFEVEPR
jgi:hypothetical protein